MLKVYAAKWCPHCVRTVDFLKSRGVPFEYIEIEEQPEAVVRRVVEVNGGEDWGVPTLEFDGRWRPGKVFDEKSLLADLRALGLEL
jgi:mycoredoxin